MWGLKLFPNHHLNEPNFQFVEAMFLLIAHCVPLSVYWDLEVWRACFTYSCCIRWPKPVSCHYIDWWHQMMSLWQPRVSPVTTKLVSYGGSHHEESKQDQVYWKNMMESIHRVDHESCIMDWWICQWHQWQALSTHNYPMNKQPDCAIWDIPPKLKSREISFVFDIRFSCLITLKFCTEHGSITAVLCVQFQNDWATVK